MDQNQIVEMVFECISCRHETTEWVEIESDIIPYVVAIHSTRPALPDRYDRIEVAGCESCRYLLAWPKVDLVAMIKRLRTRVLFGRM